MTGGSAAHASVGRWPGAVGALVLCCHFLCWATALRYLPPAAVALFNPCAGVALAAMLYGGFRPVAAAWLTAAGFHLATLPSATGDSHLVSALAAGILAVGTVVQGAVGALLLRRHLPRHSKLLNPGELLTFCTLVGPLTCWIGATWSCVTLYVLGRVDLSGWPAVWIPAFAGGVVASLLVTPHVAPGGAANGLTHVAIWEQLALFMVLVLGLLTRFSLTDTLAPSLLLISGGALSLCLLMFQLMLSAGKIAAGRRALDDAFLANDRINQELQAEVLRRQLAESEARQKDTALEAASFGVMLVSQDGRCVSVNRAQLTLLGRDVIGQDWMVTVHPSDLEVLKTAFARMLIHGQGEVEIRSLRPDGTTVWQQMVLVRCRDEANAVSGHYCLTRDITRERGVAAALATARDEALQSARIKSDFLANMSHEVRTPMSGVIGMLDLLGETPLTEEQREYLETARRSARGMLRVVNDVLDFSKIEAGRLQLENRFFDLRDSIQDIGEAMASRAGTKDVELVLEYPRRVARHFIGDEGRISQILSNLLDNALKFTDAGRVVLSVGLSPRPPSNPIFARMKISVQDTGIGIPSERLTSMFQKFTQADESTTRRYGGTGLGLAICKQLVELMRGSLNAISAPGVGSSFTVEIELLKHPQVDTDSERPELLDIPVLLVDDDPVCRAVLCEFLASHGLRCTTASSIEEALLILQQSRQALQPFRLAILDEDLGREDGWDLARAIRENADLNHLVMMMLTVLKGTPNPERSDGIAVGAKLTKPVRLSRIIGEIVKTMERGVIHEPVREPPSAPVSPRPEPAPVAVEPGTRPCRVLVAEDNSVNQLVVRVMLEKLGCTVQLAENGREAVEMCFQACPDLILMDCQMPVMDGYEATAQIRMREGESRRTPIVALTARALSGDRELCLESGFDDYVAKPISMKTLAEVVENWGSNRVPPQLNDSAHSGADPQGGNNNG